jgi:hypothetical protein
VRRRLLGKGSSPGPWPPPRTSLDGLGLDQSPRRLRGPSSAAIRRRLAAPTIGAALASVFTFALTSGCEDVSHADISDEINVLVRRNDDLVPPATDRLAAYKRKAIPQIETAIHTADSTGRLHLVTALDRIGDDEAVPILRHVAVFDTSADVRAAAEGILGQWSGAPPPARANRAGAALAEIARKRAAGEGPLLYGAGGLPGVPSTVGAPEPLSAAPPK